MPAEYTLSEVTIITGLKYEKLKVDSRRGLLPTEVRLQGNRPYKVITAETLANLLQKRETGGYEDLKRQWYGEMLVGTHSGTSTPVSRNYDDKLDWALKKLWEANEVKPPFGVLNADTVRKVFAKFRFDEEARRDYYSSKMQIYKVVTIMKAKSNGCYLDKTDLQYHPDEDIDLFFPERNRENLMKEAKELAKTLGCAVRPPD